MLNIEIIISDPKDISDAKCPEDITYQGYLDFYKNYECKEENVIRVACKDSGLNKADAFKVASCALRAAKQYGMDNEAVEGFVFLCEDEDICNMYKVAYNYWLAIDHDSRMEVPHDHLPS